MYFHTQDPVLLVQEAGIGKIDPQKPEDLFGMWSVFSKASGIMEHGKRFENLSWRLWQQQTLFSKNRRRDRLSGTRSHPHLATAATATTTATNSSSRLPQLSSSVDSACSTESSDTDRLQASTSRSAISLTDPADDMCGFSPVDLQHLVLSIKSKQDLSTPIEPLPQSMSQKSLADREHGSTPTPQPQLPQARPNSSPRNINVQSSTSTIESSTTTDSAYMSPAGNSETSIGSDSSRHSVVRGFEPGTGISTYRSQSQLAQSPTPILKTARQASPALPRRKGNVFHIGGSSVEEDNSPDENAASIPTSNPRSVSKLPTGPLGKKQISFVDQKKKPFMFADDDDGAAVESESEDDSQDEEVSESAIDDDDDAWEDEGETEEPAPKQLVFHRVESKPDITSRRSILTDNIHERGRAAALQNAASHSHTLLQRSRTSTPHGPSLPASPTEESPIKIQEDLVSDEAEVGSATQSRPVAAAANHEDVHPPCPPMSPRATRRNMVSQELGVSLRKHMLHERQYKNVYSNNSSPLRRAHTATDVRTFEATNEPGPQYPVSKGAPPRQHTSADFDDDMSDYHRKGW